MGWTAAESPLPPAHEPDVVTLDDAYLTRFDRAPLHVQHSPGAPRDWMTGAVHRSDGTLVEASRRSWAGDRSAPVSVDPPVVRPRARAPRLDGTWRYAGHFTQHFGHFVLEVLPNLWGPPTPVDGLLLHRSYRGPVPHRGGDGLVTRDLLPWQRTLLDLAGYPDVAVSAVRHRPLWVERLVVPSRPVLLKAWAAPEAVEVWSRVSEAVGGRRPDERVFLSRRLFNRDDTSSRQVPPDPSWDAALDDAFARAGFAVVHPETLAVTEQLRVVRGARVLAGSAGSALHLSAFAAPGTRVLEVGDTRFPTLSLPTQRMVDAACGHLRWFVPYGDRDELDRALEAS